MAVRISVVFVDIQWVLACILHIPMCAAFMRGQYVASGVWQHTCTSWNHATSKYTYHVHNSGIFLFYDTRATGERQDTTAAAPPYDPLWTQTIQKSAALVRVNSPIWVHVT